ncbi:hypothetical protein BgiBS90_012233 [Biomphalaria glabrata]|nr:hypothetical protein BgiBS90_012233 [Biomphalaria glabrata]
MLDGALCSDTWSVVLVTDWIARFWHMGEDHITTSPELSNYNKAQCFHLRDTAHPRAVSGRIIGVSANRDDGFINMYNLCCPGLC